ncbi:hypothetical protein TSUD_08870 [Trifolium subterraneum]|nr:hypothetical protein TSUD_08870 [Trifolium subterraneum]
MDRENEMIPCLDFSMYDPRNDQEGSEEWKIMSKKVREACENYGCFILMCDKNKFPCEKMIIGMKDLFDLPEEIKGKHKSDVAFSSYESGNPYIPLLQTFGISDAHIGDNALAFTNLMWPQGNPTFSETMWTLCSKMLEFNSLILKMIVDAYDLPKQYNSNIEELKSRSNLRLHKYKVPAEVNKDSEIGLTPHTDKNTLTFLCQNDVQGFEVLPKTNKWIHVDIPQGGIVVIVGDTLKAWSNGRLHSPLHKVTMYGDKERYSFGLFAIPSEKIKIEVPHELVDDKMHPLRYRSFTYEEYFGHFVSTHNENALDEFIGLVF